MAANLALKGVFHGAEHIPDKTFEKMPYIGPRYFQPKDHDQNQQNQDSNSDDERRSRRRSRRERRRAENEKANRGYDSDQGPAATNVPPVGGAPPSTFVPRPYNPAEYGARPGTRDAYFAGHPQEQQPAQYRPQTPLPAPNDQAHSTAADRYVPNNHDAYKHETHARNPSPGHRRRNSLYGGSPLPQALVVRPPQPGTLYPEYQPPQWGNDDGDNDHGHRRSGSRRRDSRGKSRSRSRAGSRMREELHKHKDAASTSIGMLAGSIIGNQVTARKGHSSTMGLVGGAILGGVVGHVLEQGYEKEKGKKKKKEQRRRRYSDSYGDY